MVEHGRLLLGAFERADDAVAFANRVVATPSEWIRAQWLRARDAFLAGPNGEPHPSPTELDTETLHTLAERMDVPLFRASLKGRSWRLANVPLDALLITQPLVNLSRVDAMTEKLRQGVVPTMFPTTTTLDVKAEASDGPTITLIAERGELVVSGAEVRRDGECGAIEIAFRIEPRPNYISVLNWEGRLVVRNGNHRFVAAWQAGLREVPCLLVEGEITELIRKRWDRFSIDSLRCARCPRLVDLAAPADACVEVALRRRRFITQVRSQQCCGYEDELADLSCRP